MIDEIKIKKIKDSNPFKFISSDIKLIALDVDGVLTDGSIFFDDYGNQMKRFNSKDGIGVRLLQNYGLNIALISGSKSESIKRRGLSLDIKFIVLGAKDKLYAF